MKKDCSHFSTMITGYIDRELNSADAQETKSHLSKCRLCKEAYRQEIQVKRLVKERLPVYEAPVSLQRRIRRQLVRSGEKPGFWQLVHSLFVYRPGSASLACAVLLCLVVLPVYQMSDDLLNQSPVSEEATPRTNDVELKGKIVCLDCNLFAQEHGDLARDPAIHRPGIVTEDQNVWTFLNAGAFTELLHKRDVFDRNANVRGDLIRNAHYVYVRGYEIL